jgi:cation:H+ antiporter
MVRSWQLKILLTILVAVPSLVLRIAGIHPAPLVSVIVFGGAVVASAFLLAWAAEAAEADISASLAVAVLAFIAVLPEYAVDLYFAYKSGSVPAYEHFAAANMTGSNRLLLGLGWPLVTFVFILAARRRGQRVTGLRLEPKRRVELAFLAIAGVYSLVIPLTKRLSLIDTAVLLTLFFLYMRRVASEERGEPEFMGVAAELAALPRTRRRIVVASMFALAAAFILSAAQPFADALVETGKAFGIDEFLLVQWIAPLASEAPEFIVAALWAARGKGDHAMGTLLSSKVNQWTLLVGSLALAHFVGGGGWYLSLDGRQTEEFILTIAQTILGFAILVDLKIEWKEALLLAATFLLQFPFPETRVRLFFSVAYVVVAAYLLVTKRRHIAPTFRSLPRPRRTDD